MSLFDELKRRNVFKVAFAYVVLAWLMAQVSRLNDMTESDRSDVLALLCGPERFLTSWQPAPETCERYQKEGRK